jgi:FMN phosphatase YigB (HAD superfamily)
VADPRPTQPSPTTPPRLVVFDAGGVIVRLAPFWEGVLARAGIVLSVDQASPEFVAANEAAARAHQLGSATTEEFVTEMGRAAGLDPAEVEAILAAHLIEQYPGLDEVFDRLERAGVDTALLSNTNAYHWAKMFPPADEDARAFPVIQRIHHRFGSHVLGLMKPDPAIYRAVEERTGVSGDAVLFFDDLPGNVEGARAHGWRAVLIDPDGDPAAQILAALRQVGI